jgi:hypothetical protein
LEQNDMAGNTLNEHVGITYSALGTPPAFDGRQDEHGATVVAQVSGKYAEPAKRGNVFSAFATGLTPTTSIAGTTSAPLVLYNPLGSGKRLKILKVSYAQAATGTLGTGAAFHCGFALNGPQATQSNTLPTGSSVTPQNMDIGGPNASVATVLSTATLHAAAVALYPFIQQNQSAGGTLASGPGQIFEDVDGMIVLEQGSGYTVGTVSAAGSSPLVDIGMSGKKRTWRRNPRMKDEG